MDIKERFLYHVSPEPNTGCWLWLGPEYAKGYGAFHFNAQVERAHRAAYRLWIGEPNGFVCHKCDVRFCVNPQHLYLGTHADNMRDMKTRNRAATGLRSGAHTKPLRRTYGERNGQAKLSYSLIPIIKADPRPHRIIAKDFGVSESTIANVKRNKHWTEGASIYAN
jgi:hypothetical protein